MDLLVADVCQTLPLAVAGSVEVGLPVSVALAAVALIGYLFGNRTRSKLATEIDGRRQQELDRAARIAWQMESIANGLRHDLVTHHTQLAKFKRQLQQAQEDGRDMAWERLCSEAEAMLGPTMQLGHQLSNAYDKIRQQSEALETFTQGRTDPLTGVGNGRALEQQLQVLLNGAYRGSPTFSVALVSLDRDSATKDSRSTGVISLLPRLASVIRTCMRDSDFVARYGDDEFVIVMPQTTLAGARVFANRVRKRTTDDLSASVCCGLTEAQPTDDARTLLSRTDSALYSAKAAGQNRLFVHTGSQIREDRAAISKSTSAPLPIAGEVGIDLSAEPAVAAEI
ncbi:MAG TPA: GGDEF domain-containing protein [Lacipirellulaceae bacterium]|jgi:diguanylate cyclase (GGDEF)-like protein|nr:GGDEF domain-containing protein [Lacipirellulaceae bacterium]